MRTENGGDESRPALRGGHRCRFHASASGAADSRTQGNRQDRDEREQVVRRTKGVETIHTSTP